MLSHAVAGNAWLAGDPAAGPLGAAAVAAVLLCSVTERPREKGVPIVDGWTVEHGLPFAARATVELLTLMCRTCASPSRRAARP